MNDIIVKPSPNTEPRRLTGPWDEAIVRAYRTYQATKDHSRYWNDGLTYEEVRAARRAAMYIPGEPATMYIGSDSYRMLVIAVDRYKSGAKRGQVKAIHAVHLNHDNTPRPSVEWDYTPMDAGDQPTYTYGVETYTRREPRWTGPCYAHSRPIEQQRDLIPRDECFNCWEAEQPRFVEKGQDYCTLVVGYAEDYRDPHF